jgi:hypothetical protein
MDDDNLVRDVRYSSKRQNQEQILCVAKARHDKGAMDEFV